MKAAHYCFSGQAVRQVKAEHRRGTLRPAALPLGVAAIDGKCLGKVDSWDGPNVQAVRPEKGRPYGLVCVHRAHLVSSEACVCIDQAPIPGNTNELGAVCAFTRQLIKTYRRTHLFEAIAVDAGNTSLEHASLIHGHDLGYIMALKQPAGDIYQEALPRGRERGGPDAVSLIQPGPPLPPVSHPLCPVLE